ncbi:osmoprotectant transport system substrate-binding protein [Psychromicrobium silvestre]|uniref:Osmoprotectant transport system substrate-binding protein n=1 Tax=Psychromicrobium silvestre TaxID=1645614 RepID=A0A7Y9S863_9MICC|nr:ABC transporter substrate-binding protein [Psychromicrobium silvestre]NYE95107.1 osmoprotectant transport system substrate-binding protein [Psychromicrobium silvestre]
MKLAGKTFAKRALLPAGAVMALALTLTACGGNPMDSPSGSSSSGAAGSVTVGSANFPESQVIAQIYAGALEAAGVTVTSKLNIGSREAYVGGLKDGSIDLIPDYTGNLLGYLDPKNTISDKDGIVKALPTKLTPLGLSVLDPAAAEDKDAMVVTKATAQKYSLSSIEDLAKVCDKVALAAPPEFSTRDYGLPGLKAKYSCVPSKFQPITDGGGPLTVKALTSDQVQVADIFTTSPAIPDNALVVLSDPKNNFLAQQVIPLYKTDKLSDAAKQALNNVSKQLTTDDLINLNRQVSGDQKLDPKDAAQQWLKDKGIVK